MKLEKCVAENRTVPVELPQVRSIMAVLKSSTVTCERCHVARAVKLMGVLPVCATCGECIRTDRRVALAREQRRGFGTPSRDARERRLRQALTR